MFSLVLSAVLLGSCTSKNVPPSTESASTTNGPVALETGIHGTLPRFGTAPGGDDLLEGQILVWATSEDEPAGTTTAISLFGWPTEAVPVDDGEFAVELGPS
jgi:hypothetical protein